MVYVDTQRVPYHGMLMAHMLADSSEELNAMADRIGVARRWLQQAGTPREHYDICQKKRALAIKAGAQEIGLAEVGQLLRRKRAASQATASKA